ILSAAAWFLLFFFFFQAEDGIRDFHVTGVQTCALPIWRDIGFRGQAACDLQHVVGVEAVGGDGLEEGGGNGRLGGRRGLRFCVEIGRASCRERVEMSVGAGSGNEEGEVKERRRDGEEGE